MRRWYSSCVPPPISREGIYLFMYRCIPFLDMIQVCLSSTNTNTVIQVLLVCAHIKFAEQPAACVCSTVRQYKGNLICTVVKLNVKCNLTDTMYMPCVVAM